MEEATAHVRDVRCALYNATSHCGWAALFYLIHHPSWFRASENPVPTNVAICMEKANCVSAREEENVPGRATKMNVLLGAR